MFMIKAITIKVQTWISSNQLRLNLGEFTLLGTRQAKARIDREVKAVAIPDWEVKCVVQYLGVLLDEDLSVRSISSGGSVFIKCT